MSNKEIENLEQKLSKLQLDFNKQADEITNQLQSIRRRQSQQSKAKETETLSEEEVYEDARAEQPSTSSEAETIKLGDWVVVTNDYKYIEKGKIGIVYKFNKKKDRLWLRTKQGENIQRAPWNVAITQEPSR